MSSQKPTKRKRKNKQDHLVLQLLIIVAVVLIVFEGKLVMTMISHRSSVSGTSQTQEAGTSADNTDTLQNNSPDNDSDSSTAKASASGNATESSTDTFASQDRFLAGFAGNVSSDTSVTSSTEAVQLPTVSNPDSDAIVPKASSAVDDSYFSDAVFIGDSRMEGFRNASGITQGQFFTSVGMSLSSMASDNIIQTSDGNITVAAALSGGSYNKIYIMLGTNDLGEYDWNVFQEGFISVTKRFRELQPNAILYICSVIYVEESKVDSVEYVNNTNVDKINSILLDICEEEGYYYLDLNEIFSNGYGSLIDGASSDGVHLYADYCKQMLDYLKTHYIAVDDASSAETETETETEDTV
jgi:hypothetical protein